VSTGRLTVQHLRAIFYDMSTFEGRASHGPEGSPEELDERQVALNAKERRVLRLLVEGWWADESNEGEEMKYSLLRKLSS